MMGGNLSGRCYRSSLTLCAPPPAVLISSEKALSVRNTASEGNKQQGLTVPRALHGLGTHNGRDDSRRQHRTLDHLLHVHVLEAKANCYCL